MPRHSSPRSAARPVGVVRVEQRGRLGRGEHGVQRQPGQVADPVGVALVAQPGAQRRPAGVLPAEQRTDGLAGSAVPQQHRLALRAQPGGDDTVDLGAGEREPDGLLDRAPDLEGVLLRPAGPREGLGDGHGRLGLHPAGEVDEDGLGGTRPLVDRQHELAARPVHQ